MTDVPETVNGIRVVTEQSGDLLNQRQLVDYAMHRADMLKWLLNLGKTPEKADGYARETVKGSAHRIDAFYRWVWTEHEDEYTTTVTHNHADAYMQELAYSDHTNAHKANTMKAVRRLFKWRHHQFGEDLWEPETTFSHDGGTSQPRDYFTREERKRLREAALDYKSIPHYNSLSPEERDQWKSYLAQRFEKPKRKVGMQDWERANSWKIPSMVWASLDAGLRPIEVKRAVTGWVDTENEVLRIPRDDSSKNRENWIVGLQGRTANALQQWLNEREQYEAYEETDALWLTQAENPYDANSLRYVIRQLCQEAGIGLEGRKISWYAIRHSTGTYMTDEKDLSAAQAQLRHKSERTTMRYDQTPVEERKDALERIG